MAYQSNKTGKQVEEILDNALLKTKQNLSEEEKEQVKENIGIGEVDLSGYATKDELPKKVSELENDKGYLTEHQDLSGLATKHDLTKKQDKLVSGKSIRTINGRSVLGEGDITIGDESLSETSTEPVQNKVVTLELKKKQDTIEDLEQIRTGVGIANEKASKALTDSQEALRQAEVATDAIATLKGLENSDEVMAAIAKEITKIAQNSSDIARIKASTVYLTKEEYDALVSEGSVSDDVEYNIFES